MNFIYSIFKGISSIIDIVKPENISSTGKNPETIIYNETEEEQIKENIEKNGKNSNEGESSEQEKKEKNDQENEPKKKKEMNFPYETAEEIKKKKNQQKIQQKIFEQKLSPKMEFKIKEPKLKINDCKMQEFYKFIGKNWYFFDDNYVLNNKVDSLKIKLKDVKLYFEQKEKRKELERKNQLIENNNNKILVTGSMQYKNLMELSTKLSMNHELEICFIHKRGIYAQFVEHNGEISKKEKKSRCNPNENQNEANNIPHIEEKKEKNKMELFLMLESWQRIDINHFIENEHIKGYSRLFKLLIKKLLIGKIKISNEVRQKLEKTLEHVSLKSCYYNRDESKISIIVILILKYIGNYDFSKKVEITIHDIHKLKKQYKEKETNSEIEGKEIEEKEKLEITEQTIKKEEIQSDFQTTFNSESSSNQDIFTSTTTKSIENSFNINLHEGRIKSIKQITKEKRKNSERQKNKMKIKEKKRKMIEMSQNIEKDNSDNPWISTYSSEQIIKYIQENEETTTEYNEKNQFELLFTYIAFLKEKLQFNDNTKEDIYISESKIVKLKIEELYEKLESGNKKDFYSILCYLCVNNVPISMVLNTIEHKIRNEKEKNIHVSITKEEEDIMDFSDFTQTCSECSSTTGEKPKKFYLEKIYRICKKAEEMDTNLMSKLKNWDKFFVATPVTKLKLLYKNMKKLSKLLRIDPKGNLSTNNKQLSSEINNAVNEIFIFCSHLVDETMLNFNMTALQSLFTSLVSTLYYTTCMDDAEYLFSLSEQKFNSMLYKKIKKMMQNKCNTNIQDMMFIILISIFSNIAHNILPDNSLKQFINIELDIDTTILTIHHNVNNMDLKLASSNKILNYILNYEQLNIVNDNYVLMTNFGNKIVSVNLQQNSISSQEGGWVLLFIASYVLSHQLENFGLTVSEKRNIEESKILVSLELSKKLNFFKKDIEKIHEEIKNNIELETIELTSKLGKCSIQGFSIPFSKLYEIFKWSETQHKLNFIQDEIAKLSNSSSIEEKKLEEEKKDKEENSKDSTSLTKTESSEELDELTKLQEKFKSMMMQETNHIKQNTRSFSIDKEFAIENNQSEMIYSDEFKEALINDLSKITDELSFIDLMKTKFVENNDGTMLTSEVFGNISLPKKYKCEMNDTLFEFIEGKIQNEVWTNEQCILFSKCLQDHQPPLPSNPDNYVRTYDINKLAHLYSPIYNSKRNQGKIKTQQWLLCPFFTDVDNVQFKGYSVANSRNTRPDALKKLIPGYNDFPQEELKSLPINILTEKDEEKNNDFTYRLSDVFSENQVPIDFPFVNYKLQPLSTFLWNRSIILLLVNKVLQSLYVKYQKIKKLDQENNSKNFTEEEKKKNEEERKQYKKDKRKEEQMLVNIGLPSGTRFLKQTFGNLSVLIVLLPNSRSLIYQIGLEKAEKEYHVLGNFIMPLTRIEEYAQNSVLSFMYSLFINEAAFDFVSILLYWLSPSPEYANELSCLWMCQATEETIYEKYLEILKEKFNEPKTVLHTYKRIASSLRLTSTSLDTYFVETSLSTPILSGEWYLMKGIKKFFGKPKEQVKNKVLDYEKIWSLVEPIVKVDIQDEHFKNSELKLEAKDFTGPSSSVNVEFEKKYTETVYKAKYKPYASSGTVAALAAGGTNVQATSESQMEEMVKIQKIIEEWNVKWKEATSKDVDINSLFNLINNSTCFECIISLFMKDQTQGVREISVLSSVWKVLTQLAESWIRPLCHARPENLIADINERSKRIKEMWKNVNNKKHISNSSILTLSIDFSQWNASIILPLMAEIVGRSMLMNGYSPKQVEAYREILKSYAHKKVMIRLSKIESFFWAYMAVKHKKGKFIQSIKKLEHKMKKFHQKKSKYEEEVEIKLNQISSYYNNIEETLMQPFEDIAQLVIENKIPERELNDLVIVVPFEWGMSQGILGNSSTEMGILAIKSFLHNSPYVVSTNYDFIQTSDDALIILEVMPGITGKEVLNSLEEWVNVFGLSLSKCKCGVSTTADIWFNSNKWIVQEPDSQDYLRTILEWNYVAGFDENLTHYPSYISSCNDTEVFHSARALKMLFKDNLGMNINTEMYTFQANCMYILPHLNGKRKASSIQTIHSLGSYLIRYAFLFQESLKNADPEQNFFYPIAKKLNQHCSVTPAISKLSRLSITNLEFSTSHGFEYVCPKYKNTRKRENFEKTIKTILFDKDLVKNNPNVLNFIGQILKSGSKEDRSSTLLLKTFYQPYWLDKTSNKQIFPIKEKLLTYLSEFQVSLILYFVMIQSAEKWKSMNFYNVSDYGPVASEKMINILYQMKGTDYTPDHIQILLKVAQFHQLKDIELLLPGPRLLAFSPLVLHDKMTLSELINSTIWPTTWLLPQEKRGESYIHEGVFCKEFFITNYHQLSKQIQNSISQEKFQKMLSIEKNKHSMMKVRLSYYVLDKNIIGQAFNIINLENSRCLNWNLGDNILEKFKLKCLDIGHYNYSSMLLSNISWISSIQWSRGRYIYKNNKRKPKFYNGKFTARKNLALQEYYESIGDTYKQKYYDNINNDSDEVEEEEN